MGLVCVFHMHFVFILHALISVLFISSWCQGLAAACDCGIPWTVIVPLMDVLSIYGKKLYLVCSPKPSCRNSLKQTLSRTFIESMFWFQQTRPQTTLLLFDGYIILTL